MVYVGQPLDTIKVKMQTFPKLYTNMFGCFVQTLKHDGIYKGLYAGTVPALVANITENSVLFMCYGMCQKVIQYATKTDSIENLSIVSNGLAGCLASFFSSIALTPTELIKCKLQAMYEMQKIEIAKGNVVQRIGPFALTCDIYRREGTRGLFRGLVPTLAREMPGYFFFFGGYEGMRVLLAKEGQNKDDIGLGKTMVAGAVGGTVFWISVYPIDVIKSRIQVQGLSIGMHTLAMKMLRTEGIASLFSGLLPTLVRTVPATATLFATYEYSKRFMHQIF